MVLLQNSLCLWLWRRTGPVSFPRSGGCSIAPLGTESFLRRVSFVTGQWRSSHSMWDAVLLYEGSPVFCCACFLSQLLKLLGAFSTCLVWKNLFLVVSIALERCRLSFVVWNDDIPGRGRGSDVFRSSKCLGHWFWDSGGNTFHLEKFLMEHLVSTLWKKLQLLNRCNPAPFVLPAFSLWIISYR